MQKLPFSIFIRELARLLLMVIVVLTVHACGGKTYYAPPPPEDSYSPTHSRKPPMSTYPSRPSSPSAGIPSAAPRAPAPSSPGYVPKSSSGVCVVERPLTSLDSRKTVVHEVGPLETIWRISRMYGVSEESIYQANHLKPSDSISIGQKLTIPGAKVMRHVISLYPSSKWKYIILHHTATDIGKASLIDRNHQDRGFWNGLGYHFLIDNGSLGKGDGQIEVAPRWIKQQRGAHCKANGMNEGGIGIALVGNFTQDCPTPAQLDSLAYLLQTLCTYYKIPACNVKGHRDVDGANTQCPGARFPWSNVRQCLSAF
ncbi:N-acetylmuramoyl-L-alanine amidase [Desulforhabdus sp. TSK]|uniref:N-acetylmuramoyl-L-alanine amidase n=1 Tax=Desulforhabdus sp. TSK TaxID=2925014 RepID=UPI001FC88DA0|nr:N-acetylmuramoyl-L-alanine amidase [Desulforhabdus sp. TSK]GKT10567.1 hypothetical protein DSTSK_38720 [Desulforhabdus sp. TSK]